MLLYFVKLDCQKEIQHESIINVIEIYLKKKLKFHFKQRLCEEENQYTINSSHFFHKKVKSRKQNKNY